MNDRELLELIAAQVGILTTNMDSLTSNVDSLTTNVDGLTAKVDSLTTDVDSLTADVDSLTAKVDGLTNKVDNVTKDVSVLKEGQNKMETELKEFREETNKNFTRLEHYIHDVDSKNADRHLEFVSQLNELKNSISRIEMNTAENWRDIARLKANKSHRVR